MIYKPRPIVVLVTTAGRGLLTVYPVFLFLLSDIRRSGLCFSHGKNVDVPFCFFPEFIRLGRRFFTVKERRVDLFEKQYPYYKDAYSKTISFFTLFLVLFIQVITVSLFFPVDKIQDAADFYPSPFLSFRAEKTGEMVRDLSGGVSGDLCPGSK